MSVFVLDRKKKALMPYSEKRARLLLTRGKAVVDRMYPFTLRLKERVRGEVQPVRVKLDPGAKVTGVAIVREAGDGQHVLHLAEIAHKSALVRKPMRQRATYRRRKRSAHLPHRAKRLDNRSRPPGWLPPSLQCRIGNSKSWVNRYQRLAPVRALAVAHVCFDLQKMANPEISGVQYQRGKLAEYDVREYLLEKWNRQCAYCGGANCPRNIDHMDPRARGGSDRVSNLTLAGVPCNQKKGAAIRVTGSLNPQTGSGVRQGLAWKWCRLLQRSDGYRYSTTKGGASSPCLKAGVSAPRMSR